MKSLNVDLIKNILIIWLTLWLIGTVLYSIYTATNNKEEVQNWFIEKHNIELNSLSKGDE